MYTHTNGQTRVDTHTHTLLDTYNQKHTTEHIKINIHTHESARACVCAARRTQLHIYNQTHTNKNTLYETQNMTNTITDPYVTHKLDTCLNTHNWTYKLDTI